jgi:SAM-dependent methyltransferase
VRTPDAIYDDLLRFQTELSFDLEQAFYRSSDAWHAAGRVLDFGAGNCYYTRKLAARNPEKEFVCVERNEALAKRARASVHPYSIEVVIGTFTDVAEDAAFDFVVVRHAMSYLADRAAFMQWIALHTTAAAGVLTIDADDAKFYVRPRLPILEAGNEEFKEKVRASGGDRDLRERLQEEWRQFKFCHSRTDPLIVHSDITARKELMYMFMMTVAEYDHGSPLPNNVREEIDSWALDPTSYLQYGMFGSLFNKTE